MEEPEAEEEQREEGQRHRGSRLARGDHDTAVAADFYSKALAEDPGNEVILEQAFLLEAASANGVMVANSRKSGGPNVGGVGCQSPGIPPAA